MFVRMFVVCVPMYNIHAQLTSAGLILYKRTHECRCTLFLLMICVYACICHCMRMYFRMQQLIYIYVCMYNATLISCPLSIRNYIKIHVLYIYIYILKYNVDMIKPVSPFVCMVHISYMYAVVNHTSGGHMA
jgi:hypothetical protein